MNYLSGLKILDLTQRLPGPLASYYLALKGAEVIKIENVHKRDPFSFLTFDEDDLFKVWYQELHQNKKVLLLDFETDHETLKTHVDWADVVIHTLDGELRESFFKTSSSKKTFLALKSATDGKPLHDLNALAHTGVLELYLNQHHDHKPPFLPIGGIAFSTQIAQMILSLEYSQSKNPRIIHESCYLQTSVEDIYGIFVQSQKKIKTNAPHLPQGAYPCYQIYQNKSGDLVALAAIEEKYWLMCQNELGLDLEASQRFSRDLSDHLKVARVFANLTTEEIEEKIRKKDLCLSIVRLKSGQ